MLRSLSLAIVTIVAACAGDSPETTPDTMLAAPSALTVTELSGGAHLTWKDNSVNEAHFMVERMVHGEGDFDDVSTLPFDSMQFHDTGVVAGKTYMYRITAMSETEVASSNEVSFTLP